MLEVNELSGEELRRSFIKFFQNKDHLHLPSAGLIPDDPSTLFTSAGMQPFVPFFTGTRTTPHTRIVTSQKCCRADDVDEVGNTWRHLTFFEMLGNFSFGDYFKKGAIEHAWEFLVDVLNLSTERLWISIYKEDDDAFHIWHEEIGISAEKIVRLGKNDNWWGPVGNSGPCGPDTEIHWDRGTKHGCEDPDCRPGCERNGCNRWGELWNLVFQQFDQQPDGSLKQLPSPGIDTGMGLERLAAAIQGEGLSVFDTDLFIPIINHIQKLTIESDTEYKKNEKTETAIRIIADHARAAAFLIGDGVVPSNEGRGYVLRRFLRRAYRFGMTLGFTTPFLHRLTSSVTSVMRGSYPELAENGDVISQTIKREEERFGETLERGMSLFERIVDHTHRDGENVINARDVFTLYDTYGFPFELTQELATERGLSVDAVGFETAMTSQRDRARAGSGFRTATANVFSDIAATEFIGYKTARAEATILAVRDVDNHLWVVLNRTPFYAEAGGQIGDVGQMVSDQLNVQVIDTQWHGDAIAHKVEIKDGMMAEGTGVQLNVDMESRNAICRAHTATHLLHSALREVLGTHIFQSGSLVEPDRLRFDFSHPQPVRLTEIIEIEQLINKNILASLHVDWETKSIEQAREMGAMALFGEKYGDNVRVVQIPGVSIELCGGTHLENTAGTGSLKIISETSVGANLRRIDALTGLTALNWTNQRLQTLDDATHELGSSVDQFPDSLKQLIANQRDVERKLRDLEARTSATQLEDLIQNATAVKGIKVVTGMVTSASASVLRQLADETITKLPSGIVVLGSVENGKVALVTKVSDDAQQRGGHAGNLIREVAKVTGGGGGGRPDFAQAGGRDPSKLNEALAKVRELLEQQLKERSA